MQCNQHSNGHFAFEVKASEDRYGTKMYKRFHIIERDVKEIYFNPEQFKSKIMHITKYDKNFDIDTAYMGTENMGRQDDLKSEHKLSITDEWYVDGKLVDRTNCRILLYYRSE